MARIYVVDDDEQLLRMVGLMLERGGHSVVTMSNPVEGLERIKADRPDLVVLDVMMPGMSGHDMTRQIRATKEIEAMPVLILTARSQEIDKKAALKSGADDYVSKPVTSQELIQRVDTLLSKKANNDKPTAVPTQKVIIAFYSMRGGVGQTTLAVNLAAALRRQSQQDVCLVDWSPSGSQAVRHMRLQPRASWADLPQNGNFDWAVLQNYLTTHPTGLRVLAGPSMPQPAHLPTTEMVTAVLEILKENHPFTILDLPMVLNPAFRVGLSMAYMALNVVAPEVISVQTSTQVNQLLAQLGINIKYRSHILNQITPDPQLNQALVEKGLNGRTAFQVNYDPNQTRALAQGVPLTLTPAQSPLPVVIGRMAEMIWQRVVAG